MRLACICIAAFAGMTVPALAHPHVFADSRMEIVGDASANLLAIRNIWRMDELFSSSVLVDFDNNANNTLDPDELAEIGETVRQSIAEWDFYTLITISGRPVRLQPPAQIRALYQEQQLILFFEMKVDQPINLAEKTVTFSTFDDSFFVAFDYESEEAFELLDLPERCTRQFTIPDPDAAAAEWMAQISMLRPNEKVPDDGIDYSKALAIHADVSCK
ncbi:DUF1007 family protein [Aureimonas fodinaquatilis]|uniref:DUF1007 family protein n=1 Tax=Aureimonas fodinaquatilis TaxID=2565783 RepID=A0A5B0E4E4_9HYPH|nr:DUF1007 family protein [Aureimonas fodinaquatilis]KAA0972279.1 DUF1007 family protein [Aureimonas fodinaquatilis]